MVCSKHFVDGIPTNENPFPTLNMDYEKPSVCSRRKLIKMDITADPIDSENELLDEVEYVGNQIPIDHCYSLSVDPCAACFDKNSAIESLAQTKEEMSKENNALRDELNLLSEQMKSLKVKAQSKKPFTFTSITSDNLMRFFTGMQKVSFFNVF